VVAVVAAGAEASLAYAAVPGCHEGVRVLLLPRSRTGFLGGDHAQFSVLALAMSSVSDSFFPMWGEAVRWASSPLGATIVGGVVVAAVIAIAARVSKGARSVIVGVFRWLLSVRITTTTRIAAATARTLESRMSRVVPARWVIGERQGAGGRTYS
jgi:hypothetical protein